MADNSLKLIERPHYSALFMLGADDREDTADNIDAVVTLHDGTHWSATVMTVGAIGDVLRKWQDTGEYTHGAFFQCPDLLIVPRTGLPAMLEALDAVIEAGGPAGFLQLLRPDEEW